ncbi:BrnA antitoxin family protein [Pelagibacterium sediminicola]|uniref:BrnA antitoxin family protein n=1 Tax=Pelagibacterium sediminicola TaxID=2248761 RepID=UPI000E3201F9|nr:BrnA antitoxin family protein [Pelagibacterium sediminicola]
MSKKPLTDKEGEVRELTAEDFASMQPAENVLPSTLLDVIAKRRQGQRGPQKSPTKTRVTLRLDTDIVEYFRDNGPGWQTRINRTLRRAMGEK